MKRYIQSEPQKPEAGGVMLGRHILNSGDIIVDKITIPMKADRQQRYHFYRSRKSHQTLIDIAWRESNGTCTYLGEWHTHPEVTPFPSYVDILNWHRKLLTDYFSKALFFVIVGTIEIKVWEGQRWLPKVTLLQEKI